MELETNGCMPFLDVLVERCEFGIFIRTKRKHTHTGLHSSWSILVSRHYERNLVILHLKLVYTIASSYRIMHEDFHPVKAIHLRAMASRQICWMIVCAIVLHRLTAITLFHEGYSLQKTYK